MWFKCNMYRIFVICVLLASIVSAAPDGRHKRHFSYIKDLITSALSGWFQSQLPPFPNVDLEDDYELYKIPGYEDILIRAKSNAPIIQETVYQPQEVLEINPLESYIGTNNPEATLVALQNVDNLLATRIFNSQETELLKETMVPIMSSLGGLTFIDKHVDLIPSRPDEAVPNKAEKTNEVSFQGTLRTRYNYKQMEKNKPVINFSTDNNPEVAVVEEIDRSSTLPLCLQERIDKVVSLGTDPLSLVTEYQNPYGINGMPPSMPDDPHKIELLPQHNRESIVPLSHTLQPLNHLNELRHDTEFNVDLTKMANNPNRNGPHIVQTLRNMPPQYVSEVHKNLPKEVKYIDAKTDISETVPHFSNKQVNHNSSDVSIKLDKEKDSLKTNVDNDNLLPNHQIYTPNGIRIGTIATDNANRNNLGRMPFQYNHDKLVIRYSGEQQYKSQKINHNDPSNFKMIKEKQEIKGNTNANHSLPRLHVSHVSHKTVTEDVGNSAKHDDVPDIFKPAENETLAEYIHELEAHNNLKPFSIAKEKNEIKTNSPINNVHVSSVTNIIPVLTNNANITTNNNDPKKSTLSNYINEHVAHNNPTAFGLKETDEPRTNIHRDSTKLSSQKYTHFRDEASTESLNNKDKTSGSRSDSHHTNKEMGEINTNITVINNVEAAMKTNPYPNFLSSNINAKTIKNPENDTTEIYDKNDLTVLEEAPVSFKHNPIVVAESSYVYHQNNADGSTMKINGNNGGVSIYVSDQNKGRGDIPDQ